MSEYVLGQSDAALERLVASRRGAFTGPVDVALAAIDLHRQTMVVVPGFSDALRIARRSDLVALVPGSCFRGENPAVAGVAMFPLPVATPEIAISAIRHPRMDADTSHCWLRETVATACRAVMEGRC